MKHVLMSALLCAWFGSAASQGMPVMELTAGFHRIEAEVAATPQTRAQGLMHRTEMPAHRGMLFVFPHDAPHCFWMKNTLIPLSIAFIGTDGRISNIAEMQPRSEDNHCARQPVRYALEMNRGWFAQRGLKAGDTIVGIDKAPLAQ